jgi:cysteine synthase
MYLPLSRSLLARRAASHSSIAQHPSTGSSRDGKQQMHASLHEVQQVAAAAAAANSVRLVDHNELQAGIAAAAGAAARCTWLQTVADVRRDEALVVVYPQQHDGCDWPGLRPPTL